MLACRRVREPKRGGGTAPSRTRMKGRLCFQKWLATELSCDIEPSFSSIIQEVRALTVNISIIHITTTVAPDAANSFLSFLESNSNQTGVKVGGRAPPHPLRVWVSASASQSLRQVWQQAGESDGSVEPNCIPLNCFFVGKHNGPPSACVSSSETHGGAQTKMSITGNTGCMYDPSWFPIMPQPAALSPWTCSGEQMTWFSSEVKVKSAAVLFSGAHIQEPHWWVTEAVSTGRLQFVTTVTQTKLKPTQPYRTAEPPRG